MNPAGVRLACPECTWDCVMKSGQDVPEGVRKVVDGVPWCPNCNQPMRPVASVDTTDRPKPGISAAMTLEQIAAKCVEIQRESAILGSELKDAAEAHKDARKAYDAKLVTLSLAVERLGRVMGGEQIQADRPLLAIAEEDDEDEPEPAAESVMGEAVRLEAEELRQHLAKHWIVVDLETITGWTLDQYDVVIAYLAGLEAVPDCGLPEPDFLPEGVPDHVQALCAALIAADVQVTLADVCGWSQGQRDAARAWVAEVEPTERPDFIPAPRMELPEVDPARVVPRRRARKPSAAVTV